MKTWEPPKLIILVRSRPEAALLEGCKSLDFPGAGPGADDTACDLTCTGWCQEDVTS